MSMFRKVHVRLTLMCAGTTAAIMIIMSLGYLYVSEQGLERNQFLSFKSDMNTIITNMEQQQVITFEWISKLEAANHYTIFVLDNGVPLLYNDLKNQNTKNERNTLLEEGLSVYQSLFLIETDYSSLLSPFSTYHVEFEFTSPTTLKDYHCCVAMMDLITTERTSIVEVVILSSLQQLQTQIMEQRIRFLIIIGFSIITLSIFAWFFTLKLLHPIEESRKQQVEFVAAASHELRTPLAVILSCASAGRSASVKETRSFLHTIENESLQMGGLIEDMLTLSKADNYTWSMQMEQVQPDTLLLEAYETFEQMALEKKINFFIDLPDSLLTYLYCDKIRISQVLAILIHNAICYTPEKGEICLLLRLTKHHVIFTVKDNGPGIPDEEKKNIFRRFYRVEKNRSTKEHSGLGLSIASEIIQAHKGVLKVKDAEGGGAVFEVRLTK